MPPGVVGTAPDMLDPELVHLAGDGLLEAGTAVTSDGAAEAIALEPHLESFHCRLGGLVLADLGCDVTSLSFFDDKVLRPITHEVCADILCWSHL